MAAVRQVARGPLAPDSKADVKAVLWTLGDGGAAGQQG